MSMDIKQQSNRWLRSVSGWLNSLAGFFKMVAHQIDLKRIFSLTWQNRSDDVFVVTYPRSGTTLMQMMLYQLTTNGSMDFQHITTAIPWLERRILSNPDAAVEMFEFLKSPRVFKTHFSYADMPKVKGKFIYVMRNGEDVMVSYYHFYQSHLSFKGTFDDFFEDFMNGRVQYQSWFQHVQGWWHHRHDPNILFLRYEEIISDLENTTLKVADFLDIKVTPERLSIISERCGFLFMKQYQEKFDHTTGLALDRGYQLNAFIRQGKKGSGEKTLNQHQLKRFETVLKRDLGDCTQQNQKKDNIL